MVNLFIGCVILVAIWMGFVVVNPTMRKREKIVTINVPIDHDAVESIVEMRVERTPGSPRAFMVLARHGVIGTAEIFRSPRLPQLREFHPEGPGLVKQLTLTPKDHPRLWELTVEYGECA